MEECVDLGLDCSGTGRISFKSLIHCPLLQNKNSSALKAATEMDLLCQAREPQGCWAGAHGWSQRLPSEAAV